MIHQQVKFDGISCKCKEIPRNLRMWWTNGQTDGQTDELTDVQTDGETDVQTDVQTVNVACKWQPGHVGITFVYYFVYVYFISMKGIKTLSDAPRGHAQKYTLTDQQKWNNSINKKQYTTKTVSQSVWKWTVITKIYHWPPLRLPSSRNASELCQSSECRLLWHRTHDTQARGGSCETSPQYSAIVVCQRRPLVYCCLLKWRHHTNSAVLVWQ